MRTDLLYTSTMPTLERDDVGDLNAGA